MTGIKLWSYSLQKWKPALKSFDSLSYTGSMKKYRTLHTSAQLHNVNVAWQKAEFRNNCLLARRHHRWLTWASWFSQGTELLKSFCHLQNINKPWPCPHYVFSRAWQQGRQLLHCLSRGFVHRKKLNKETIIISKSQDAPLSWREIFTCDLNSILFHGLSRDVFFNLL